MKNLENNYVIFWQNEINSSENLDFYPIYKQEFHTNNYINTLRNSQERQSFAKFCTSNHDLLIEKGRHYKPKIPREERICNLCNSNETEDDIHFLFHCSRYEILRKSFLARQCQLFNKFFDNDIILCHALFTTDNKNSIHCTAKYINCASLRKTLTTT